MQGYDVGAPLEPQAPLSPAGREEVRGALDAVGALYPFPGSTSKLIIR